MDYSQRVRLKSCNRNILQVDATFVSNNTFAVQLINLAT